MDHSLGDNQPSGHQGPDRTSYGVTGQPSATSSLRRVFQAQAGSGLDTPSTVDERTALLGMPEDLEQGSAPKASSNRESYSTLSVT